jgi:opacity protein-like surface antigen
MKTLLAMAALAAVIASPAFAQTGTRRVQAAEHPSQYDQPVGRAEAQPRSAAQGTTVYDNNHYLGADPDPNVRLDLRRDFNGRDF